MLIDAVGVPVRVAGSYFRRNTLLQFDNPEAALLVLFRSGVDSGLADSFRCGSMRNSPCSEIVLPNFQ